VISIKPSKYGQDFVLEKHPRLILGYAEFPSENPTLTEFMEDPEPWGKQLSHTEWR
jgi:hypothetical protein